MTAEELVNRLRPDMIRAFSSVPEYGELGFTVRLRGGEMTCIEWTGSITQRVQEAKPKESEPLMGIREAALELGVSSATVRNYWLQGKIVGVRVGKLVRFNRATIEEFKERGL
jgi:DNA binding domain, excisionase family